MVFINYLCLFGLFVTGTIAIKKIIFSDQKADTNVGIAVLIISIMGIIFWEHPSVKRENKTINVKNDDVVTIDELMENTDTLYMITEKDTIKIYK